MIPALEINRPPAPRFGFLAAAIMLLGLGLRLWALPLMLFDFDEGVASIYALQLTHRGDFPLVGVKTSLGFYNPPLFIYLISPAFLLSTSPLVATGWLQVLWLAGMGALGWQLYGRGWRWGLITVAVLAALAPAPLLLTGRLWGHALIPPLSAGVVAAILAAQRQPGARGAAFCIPLLVSGAQQVHFSGALLGMGLLLCIALAGIKLNWRWFATGCLAAALTYTAYVIHQVRSDFADVRTVGRIIAGNTPGEADAAPLWMAALHTLSDFGGATAFQQNYPTFLSGVPWFVWLKWILAGTWFVSLSWVIWKVARRRGSANPLFLIGLIWTLVPLVSFTLLKVVTVPAYWLVALPGPFLLVGAVAEAISRSRAGRFGVAIVLATAGTGFCGYYLAHQAAIKRAEPTEVVYPTYRDQRDAISFISQAAPPGGAHATQEARGVDGGIDFQLLYLMAMIEKGESTRLRKSGSEAQTAPQFIIHSRARPRLPALEGRQPVRFGLLEVYPPD